MDVKMRYVTARPSRRNPERWYWQRKGFPLTRLPDDPAERWAMVENLNRQADGVRPAGYDTMQALIDRVRHGDRWAGLAGSTRKTYAEAIARFPRAWLDLPPAALSRRVVVEYVNSLSTPSVRRLHAAVLAVILGQAHDEGLIAANPAHRLRLSKPAPRRALWTLAQEDAFLLVAKPKLRRAFLLMLYTGQRPGDALAMTRGSIRDGTVTVRQQKTGATVAMPLHSRLAAELEHDNGSLLLAGYLGGPTTRYRAFKGAFDAAKRKAGLDNLQPRDLRRTAVTRLAEAGCTVPQIAAVTGHSVEATQAIIDTYLVRTAPLAKAAMARWEERTGGAKSNAAGGESNT